MDKKWGWISMIDRLSGGDITKHEAIFELEIIHCFNILGYWTERDAFYRQINKRAEMINNKR